MASVIVLDGNEEELQYAMGILRNTGMFSSIQGFCSPEAAYIAAIEEKGDVLFLEAEFKNMNCFLLIDKIQKLKQDFFYVIITDNRNYAFEAIKKGVVDYLIKPLTEEEVIKTLKKIGKYLK